VAPQQIQQDGEININKVQYMYFTAPFPISIGRRFCNDFTGYGTGTQLGIRMLGSLIAVDPDPHGSASFWQAGFASASKSDLGQDSQHGGGYRSAYCTEEL
jgi:hypothetical protein